MAFCSISDQLQMHFGPVYTTYICSMVAGLRSIRVMLSLNYNFHFDVWIIFRIYKLSGPDKIRFWWLASICTIVFFKWKMFSVAIPKRKICQRKCNFWSVTSIEDNVRSKRNTRVYTLSSHFEWRVMCAYRFRAPFSIIEKFRQKKKQYSLWSDWAKQQSHMFSVVVS